MDTKFNFINFEYFCHYCVHEKTESSKEPCNECLEMPVRANDHTPINFKLAERRKNK